MTANDADAVADAILRSGWGDRRAKMRWVGDHPGCLPFVAEVDGAVVGTGVTTINGPVGWIGTIWVEPTWRGRGIGTALTLATMEAAEVGGCTAMVLVATAAGQPLYERLGFEVQTRYRILEAPGVDSGTPDPRIRPFEPRDLAAMVDLDTAATGEDREHLLAALATPDTTHCLVRNDGRLGGYILRPPWGGGATIAPRPDDALAILGARRARSGPGRRVRAGLLEANTVGAERLLAAGWSDSWQAPRLVRGRMPDWHPDAIWGQFDHAMG
jgi:predicted N-acetyltransferase YhbS